jgi:hypothetical protein
MHSCITMGTFNREIFKLADFQCATIGLIEQMFVTNAFFKPLQPFYGHCLTFAAELFSFSTK